MSQAHTKAMTRGDHEPWEPDEHHQEFPTVEMSSVSPLPPRRPSRVRKMGGALGSSTGIWVGLAITAAGFVGIVIAWVKTAGLVNVALQVPYVVSGGLAGLALVIVGMAVVDIAVRRQDSHERRQQLAQISEVLAELREYLQTEEHGEPREYDA